MLEDPELKKQKEGDSKEKTFLSHSIDIKF